MFEKDYIGLMRINAHENARYRKFCITRVKYRSPPLKTAICILFYVSLSKQ